MKKSSLNNSITLIILTYERNDQQIQAKTHAYAIAHIQDYWLIDLQTKALLVHREPTAKGYQSVDPSQQGTIIPAAFSNSKSPRPTLATANCLLKPLN